MLFSGKERSGRLLCCCYISRCHTGFIFLTIMSTIIFTVLFCILIWLPIFSETVKMLLVSPQEYRNFKFFKKNIKYFHKAESRFTGREFYEWQIDEFRYVIVIKLEEDLCYIYEEENKEILFCDYWQRKSRQLVKLLRKGV